MEEELAVYTEEHHGHELWEKSWNEGDGVNILFISAPAVLFLPACGTSIQLCAPECYMTSTPSLLLQR